jgi:hypothetical protein
MKENRESRVPIEGITNAEISSAIRYLDPEYQDGERSRDRADSVLMICLCLIILLGGALAFIMLSLRTS